jgi:hypothetical protein
MAVIFHWEPGDEHFVAMQDGLGGAMLLKEADGNPVMIAKFYVLLPEWQERENRLAEDGETLADYFNTVEQVFACIPSPITGRTP